MKLSITQTPTATTPSYGSASAAGLDLYACESMTILPTERALIDTGISIQWDDETFYGRIAPRSGLSVKGIDIGAGVIDFDYRGKIKVCFINNGKNSYTVNQGDRIAQLIFEKTTRCELQITNTLDESIRGNNGFGSTGK